MIRDIVNELSGNMLCVAGISALELHNYNVTTNELEVLTEVRHSNVKCVGGIKIPARYQERMIRYNDNVFLLSKYDALCIMLLRWSREDIQAIKESGVLDDISASKLVHILNREVDKSTKECILARYASVIGTA